MKQTTLSIAYLIAFLLSPILAFANTSLFTDATVYGHPEANAVGVKNGVITFIGTEEASRSHSSIDTEVIDLQGAALYPGFIDNHNHVFEAASEVGGACEVSAEASLEAQIPYLQFFRKSAKPGQWVIGYGHWLESILSDEDKHTPLEVLGNVFPDQPVVIMEQTSHSMWVNSQALAKVGFTAKSKDPKGGVILKDEGFMLGILLDNAGDLVMEQAWNSLQGKFNQSYDGLINGLQAVAANGITTIIPQYPHGINYISQNDMQWWLQQLNAIGYGAHIHTFGDGGVHESLDAIAAAKQAGSKQDFHKTPCTK